ncbi:hypothetical protein CB1_002349006 [Camelus ferus]|nr:hypothetical protein CB1_002349006 [Camelus ferus]
MESISMMGSPKSLSETFLPNGMNGIKDAKKVTVGVIGSGDFAKSLTIRLIRCGYHVVIGSRNPKFASEFFPHVVDVTHHEDVLVKTNIIFVAIHREHYTSLWDLRHLLVGKILIDVSNNMRINQYPESNAEYLASLFPDSLIVKGFNVVSAWALQLGPKDASRQSTLGYVALLISTFHVVIYGWKRAFEEEYYRFYTPPNFVLALVLPSIVILGAEVHRCAAAAPGEWHRGGPCHGRIPEAFGDSSGFQAAFISLWRGLFGSPPVGAAEAREPGTRIKSSSPRQIPAVGVVTEDEEAQVLPKPPSKLGEVLRLFFIKCDHEGPGSERNIHIENLDLMTTLFALGFYM